MNIKIARYRISFCADNDMHLPSYAGSALRGMFGHALKSMACPTANGRSCRCQEDCLYRTLFDPPQTHTHDRKQDTPPPFIIEARSLPRHIKAGQTAYFYMTLIGKVAHSEQMMIELAWRRALSMGFDQKDKTKATAKFIGMSKFDSPFGSPIKPMPPTELILDLLTPTRIQHHGKLLNSQDLTASLFCQALMRRYVQLSAAYGDKPDDDELKSVYQDIENVTGECYLSYRAWSRFSHRQHRVIPQDGLVGRIELHGVSERLYHYLHLGQWLHIGKGTVFGLGQYQLR
ncbi:CRISPR system precrRNA processing endoribonuclease RAMP protein Cas6 [Moraxella bovoculi]|uniref:CRISPR system precrRNA processing endoribonuclease RAMP protein Cas6 n=1 Tax=Moraxella bovoculi TaxID=386891 RepID=UPI003F4FB01A